MYEHFTTRTVVPLLGALLLFAACETVPFTAETPSSATIDVELTADKRTPVGGNIAAQLAAVRNLTAPFHNFDKAAEAGWFAQLSPCVEHPEFGGMGYHYGNPAYLGNGYIDALKPEALLYEPMKNGKLRLVAVEYILPFAPPAEEGGDPIEGDQPSLFGEAFQNSPHVGEFGAWTLHVWLWRNNPEGMFAEWNPNVSCAFAPEA